MRWQYFSTSCCCYYTAMSSSFKRRGKKAAQPSLTPAVSAETSTSSDETSSFTSILTEQTKLVATLPKSKAPTQITSLPGTKPWTNNLTLTSFGLREVDSFLFSSGGEGGGQPL